MAPRRNVLRCFWIWFSAHTLTCYVGRCWVTHLHAKRFWQSGFIEEQGVRAKPPPEGYRLPWSTAESCPDCRSVVAWVLSSTWPRNGRAGRRASERRWRACSMARQSCCEKTSRHCGWRWNRRRRLCSGMDYVCDHVVVWGKSQIPSCWFSVLSEV